MITSEDKDILESAETKLIANVIKQTILTRFKLDRIRSSIELQMYYVNPETGERYIEEEDIMT